MISLLRERNYGLLWRAAFISATGDFMLRTALPYYVYASTGSPLASGLTFVFQITPMVLFSATGGVLADRWKRKPVMAGADFSRAVCLLPLLAVNGHHNLWIVYVVAFSEGTASYFSGPFGNAAIPNVVGKDRLQLANSAFQTGANVAALIGPVLAGFVLIQTGLTGIVIADSVSYVVSGALVMRLRSDLEAGRVIKERPSGRSLVLCLVINLTY